MYGAVLEKSIMPSCKKTTSINGTAL